MYLTHYSKKPSAPEAFKIDSHNGMLHYAITVIVCTRSPDCTETVILKSWEATSPEGCRQSGCLFRVNAADWRSLGTLPALSSSASVLSNEQFELGIHFNELTYSIAQWPLFVRRAQPSPWSQRGGMMGPLSHTFQRLTIRNSPGAWFLAQSSLLLLSPPQAELGYGKRSKHSKTFSVAVMLFTATTPLTHDSTSVKYHQTRS